MSKRIKKTWPHLASRLVLRPPAMQVAAICVRVKSGEKQILLITSRGTGRWIVPKGWPMRNKSNAEAALQEAWEEAGVKSGKVSKKPLGRFHYDKLHDDGHITPIEAEAFLVDVEELSANYPEADQRTRQWVAPAAAARLVSEKGLKALLLSL
ncbi:NUDIX domain protein [Thalassovita gelatinovora]|uniref:NUDIX domain protein n=1 Tax=Thalassovita gelatinovora TaxID=53501 RepID=A0A0P1FWM0_THAGE|nr:NUDIX hydrolase [Thalassovita gelatinovora]QIZ80560.1 NUDIX hydrolase [Thalassovita gelatinovora]CUH66054.1 NUDIX domain protein [Thalassovita gelatinovora]SEQ76190.1 8-oxo-dGTP pyrophosphatase MutT, NUDIX family [Thalassovita gelatinovora]